MEEVFPEVAIVELLMVSAAPPETFTADSSPSEAVKVSFSLAAVPLVRAYAAVPSTAVLWPEGWVPEVFVFELQPAAAAAQAKIEKASIANRTFLPFIFSPPMYI
jgi:hypothetical protein